MSGSLLVQHGLKFMQFIFLIYAILSITLVNSIIVGSRGAGEQLLRPTINKSYKITYKYAEYIQNIFIK